MTLAWRYAVIGRESFCMSVSVVTQVYEMTMLETNGSQKLYRYELSRVHDVLVEFKL